MSGPFNRTFLAQLVIALAVCIGAWFVFVEPKAVEAQRLESAIQEGSQEAQAVDQSAVKQLVDRLAEVRKRVDEMERRGRLAEDSSYLYSVVMDLARTHRVTVVSINPGAVQTAQDGVVVRRELSISVSGRYEQIAEFVSALQSIDGYLDISYLSVASASSQSDQVNARMTCRTLRFNLPERLQGSLEEHDDA